MASESGESSPTHFAFTGERLSPESGGGKDRANKATMPKWRVSWFTATRVNAVLSPLFPMLKSRAGQRPITANRGNRRTYLSED